LNVESALPLLSIPLRPQPVVTDPTQACLSRSPDTTTIVYLAKKEIYKEPRPERQRIRLRYHTLRGQFVEEGDNVSYTRVTDVERSRIDVLRQAWKGNYELARIESHVSIAEIGFACTVRPALRAGRKSACWDWPIRSAGS